MENRRTKENNSGYYILSPKKWDTRDKIKSLGNESRTDRTPSSQRNIQSMENKSRKKQGWRLERGRLPETFLLFTTLVGWLQGNLMNSRGYSVPSSQRKLEKDRQSLTPDLSSDIKYFVRIFTKKWGEEILTVLLYIHSDPWEWVSVPLKRTVGAWGVAHDRELAYHGWDPGFYSHYMSFRKIKK